MTNSMKKAGWITIFFIFCMLTTRTFAQQQKEIVTSPGHTMHQEVNPGVAPPSPPDAPLPPPPPDDMERFCRPALTNLPGLTAEQLEKIRRFDLKHLESITPLRNQMREKRARLNTLLSTPPINIKEAEQVADDVGKIHATILKQQIRHDQDLRSILTPEQQIIFDAKPKPFLGKPGALKRRFKPMTE